MTKGGLYRQILAWVLLLILSITILPFQLWHAHEENIAEQRCHFQDKALEKDACHVSIYHLPKAQKPVCGHQVHLHSSGKHCLLCEFATVSFSYCFPELPTSPCAFYSVIDWAKGVKQPIFPAQVRVIFNKGPPAPFPFLA